MYIYICIYVCIFYYDNIIYVCCAFSTLVPDFENDQITNHQIIIPYRLQQSFSILKESGFDINESIPALNASSLETSSEFAETPITS